MILSRTIAKARITNNQPAGVVAAYWPVLLDFICVVLVIYLLSGPFKSIMDAVSMPIWAAAVTFIFVAYIPAQVVLIISALWAAKSRWTETDTE